MRWPHEGEAAYNQENAKEDNPGFGREEKGTDGHCAENQQDKSDIPGLPVKIETFLFTAVVTHNYTP